MLLWPTKKIPKEITKSAVIEVRRLSNIEKMSNPSSLTLQVNEHKYTFAKNTQEYKTYSRMYRLKKRFKI